MWIHVYRPYLNPHYTYSERKYVNFSKYEHIFEEKVW